MIVMVCVVTTAGKGDNPIDARISIRVLSYLSEGIQFNITIGGRLIATGSKYMAQTILGAVSNPVLPWCML